MIKLNNILDHKVMMDRLNKIVTDGIVSPPYHLDSCETDM